MAGRGCIRGLAGHVCPQEPAGVQAASGGIEELLGSVGGIRGVLGADRVCRCSGPAGVLEALGALEALGPSGGVGSVRGCIGLAGSVSPQGPAGV